MVGLPLLAHLGYRALTSLPMGMVPARPTGAKQSRKNLDLRSRVAGFLNEVRSVEAYAQRAIVAGMPRAEVDENLRKAEGKLMAAAAEMVKVMGRTPPDIPTRPGSGARRGPVLTHGEPLGVLPMSQGSSVTRGLRGPVRH